MNPIAATEPEPPETYATVWCGMTAIPAIPRAVDKMAKQLRGLSDVSQKQDISELTAVWILPDYPKDLYLALSLSDAMRHQIDIHKRESKKVGAHH